MAVQLASLVVEVGMHIASYPGRDDSDKTMCSVTLSEVKFSNLPLDGMGKKPDNTVNAGNVQMHNEGIVDTVLIQSYSVIKNRAETRLLSQWSRDNWDSQTVAVYSIEDKGGIIILEAGFVITNSSLDRINIKIKCRGSVFYGESGNATFSIGSYQTVPCRGCFYIPINTIEDVMNVKEETLHWEVQYSTNKWEPLEDIKVRVYTILSKPKLQWYNKAIWSDALELILPVTNGENSGLIGDTYDDIYKNITERVNGQMNLYYKSESAFVRFYPGNSILNLSNFLIAVRTPNVIIGVNCSDCAAVVAAFCNMLGGALLCERMQNISDYNSGFRLNPIQTIGATDYNTQAQMFLYHEVAMWHISQANDIDNRTHKVYDASLKVNISNNPSVMDNNVQLPTGMSFSQYTDDVISVNTGQVDIVDDSYREHLCEWGGNGIGSCYYVSLPFGMAVPTIM